MIAKIIANIPHTVSFLKIAIIPNIKARGLRIKLRKNTCLILEKSAYKFYYSTLLSFLYIIKATY